MTPEIDKNQVVLEYSPGQFFRPEVISFKDYDGDKFMHRNLSEFPEILFFLLFSITML